MLAQERSYHWPPPGGEWRLHHICKRYRESPVRDYTGRIRRCYWSRPSCPWDSRCRYGYHGYDSVCCRRRFYPYPYRRHDSKCIITLSVMFLLLCFHLLSFLFVFFISFLSFRFHSFLSFLIHSLYFRFFFFPFIYFSLFSVHFVFSFPYLFLSFPFHSLS